MTFSSTAALRATTLLRGVVGSKAYGLDHAESDTDRLGVFVAPTLEVAGLDWHSSKESRVKQGPEGDDFAEHEVGKFLGLVLKANPTVTELLWLDDELYEYRNFWSDWIIENRKSFLGSKAVRGAYFGYATAQLKKFKSNGEIPKAKYARHTLRLLEQGMQILNSGHLSVKVSNPQRFFDLNDMTFEQVIDVLDKAVERFAERENRGMFAIDTVPDRAVAKTILAEIRRIYI